MDLKQTRRARLLKFAQSRGVAGDPSGLGLLIGKKPNQVYNLLNGFASFGEKVARSIETAAGLPEGWLDIDEASGQQLPGWPFSNVGIERFLALSPEDRIYVEAKLEAAIEAREHVAENRSATEAPEPNRVSQSSSVQATKKPLGRLPGELIRTGQGVDVPSEAHRHGALPTKRGRRSS